jgi:SAM-dependent methyltransferase
MNATPHASEYHGCAIPPELYDIAFGWDPQPEVNRLVFLARQAGLAPRSALELGCGTGRLLPCLRQTVPDVIGLELSPAMADFARSRGGATVLVGDMSSFALGRTFDLIFASANTLRHVHTPDAIASMWRCITDHLSPGGLFVADLELGFAAEAEKVGRPARWTLSRGDVLVHVSWEVVEPPARETRCCTVEWVFESRRGEPTGTWRERFTLRTYDAQELVELATADGRLRPAGMYELRDPYLIETPPEKAVGRMLVALQRRTPE